MAELKPGRSPEPLIFELAKPGAATYRVSGTDESGRARPGAVPSLPNELLRADIDGFPELAELEVVRHFTRLSQLNYSIDTEMYPLGSCTMKYNPRVNEAVASQPGLAQLHPYAPLALQQGALALASKLEHALCEISGLDAVSLQPAAGAQGELTGMMIIRAHHRAAGRDPRTVLIPASAHGTNPASCTLAGYSSVEIAVGPSGVLTPEDLAPALSSDVAAVMITNPNTLGLFERHIVSICEAVHRAGALVYLDGANMNAIMGHTRPADWGVDVMHFNLHKTFSTPHGGGGPGSGPVAVRKDLARFLPVPVIACDGEQFRLDWERLDSIGKVTSFYGNFAMAVRAYAYISMLGAEGIAATSEAAVLNANYLQERLKDLLHLPYPGRCMHETVLNDERQHAAGIKTLDMAKRLLDYGFHPPTVYFPLIVAGAFMVEPTESEPLHRLDAFADAMAAIVAEATLDPELVHNAPHTTPVRRLDEARAARKPILRWTP
ncbi:MAG: aminomethyl-transferring glycine dehydrogenase subunit GcvPB [Candidatus Schekmanbacteria bacterium]|nr:aminomethyl-transferring glycine dehydrogenase subunit GcvPB [Candidatus Schekmanbacteria bacterium]